MNKRLKYMRRTFFPIHKQFVLFKGLALTLLLFLLPNLSIPFAANAETEQPFKIQAAFIYRFLLFTEWPEEVYAGADQKVIIGILGQNPFGGFFKQVEGLPVNGRTLDIRHFPAVVPLEEIQQCQLLFISSSLKDQHKEILGLLKDLPVLTVSNIDGFAEAGGMIGFYMEESGVKFAVNRTAARRAGIKFRSQLLRVAPRIVE